MESSPIQPVLSPLQEAANAAADEVGEKKDRTAEFKRINRMLKGFQDGSLPFKLWKSLPPSLQAQYVRAHGRPKTDDQLRGIANAKTKRRRRNKLARQARKASR